jgi:hypothetical protein
MIEQLRLLDQELDPVERMGLRGKNRICEPVEPVVDLKIFVGALQRLVIPLWRRNTASLSLRALAR